jgi:hypothetical protein
MSTRMKVAGAVAVAVAVAGLGMPAVATTLAAGSNETHTSQPTMALRRSAATGRPHVIKVSGDVKWSNIELKR